MAKNKNYYIIKKASCETEGFLPMFIYGKGY
jgi:hypothetical protein